jgi:hypothetical protein
VFHRGEIVLTDANALGELRLCHIKAADLPDAATLLMASSLRSDRSDFRGAESDLNSGRPIPRCTAIGNSAYSSSAESLAALFWLSMCLSRQQPIYGSPELLADCQQNPCAWFFFSASSASVLYSAERLHCTCGPKRVSGPLYIKGRAGEFWGRGFDCASAIIVPKERLRSGST